MKPNQSKNSNRDKQKGIGRLGAAPLLGINMKRSFIRQCRKLGLNPKKAGYDGVRTCGAKI